MWETISCVQQGYDDPGLCDTDDPMTVTVFNAGLGAVELRWPARASYVDGAPSVRMKLRPASRFTVCAAILRVRLVRGGAFAASGTRALGGTAGGSR
jgi:hypothetical protein